MVAAKGGSNDSSFSSSKHFHDLPGTFDHRRYSVPWVCGININPEFSIAAAKGDPSTAAERLDKAAIYEAGD